HRGGGDAVQLSRLPFCDRRSRRLAVARDHARLGVPLHLARAADHRYARIMIIMKRIIAAFAFVWITVWLASGVSRTAIAQSVPKQAVVDTSAGTFVIDLTPETAPNQAAHFMRLAAEGGYDGTTFHRVIKYGMVQGGDPLSRDPAKRAQYGTGGQNAVKAEVR